MIIHKKLDRGRCTRRCRRWTFAYTFGGKTYVKVPAVHLGVRWQVPKIVRMPVQVPKMDGV